MNTLNKALIASILALGTAAAQAESPNYPGWSTSTVSPKATMAEMGQDKAGMTTAAPSPYVFMGEFLIDNPAYRMTSKPSAEIRAGIPKQRVADVYSVGA